MSFQSITLSDFCVAAPSGTINVCIDEAGLMSGWQHYEGEEANVAGVLQSLLRIWDDRKGEGQTWLAARLQGPAQFLKKPAFFFCCGGVRGLPDSNLRSVGEQERKGKMNSSQLVIAPSSTFSRLAGRSPDSLFSSSSILCFSRASFISRCLAYSSSSDCFSLASFS